MGIGMLKRNGAWHKRSLALLLAAVLCLTSFAACGPKKGSEQEQTQETPQPAVVVTAKGQKTTVIPMPEDGAYVAEPAGITVPSDASYQRGVLPNGSLWGVTNGGELWGETGLTGDWDFSDVRNALISNDTVYLSRVEAKGLEVRSLDGTVRGRIDGKGGEFEGLSEGIYALRRSGENGAVISICRLDAEKNEMGEELTAFPGDLRGIFLQGSDAENLYLYTSDAAYRYSFSEKAFYTLFKWSDVGLMGSSLWMVWKASDGAIYANDYESREYIKIVWKKAEELPKKREVTVAIKTMDSDGNLQKFVMDFNKLQDDIHVTIVPYASSASDEEWESAEKRLAADLLGDNPPDIICHANLNDLSESLASGGYLKDLREYLAKSEVLSEEDFYPEILEYGTCGDILYTIPYRFRLGTLIVPASQWKKAPGWTYDEMVAYLRDKEEWRPFRQFLFFRMYCLYLDPLDYFWDAEKRECYFDGEEFRTLLAYMKECQEKEAAVDPSDRRFNFAEMDIYGLSAYARAKKELGDIVLMGYPSPDGKPRATIEGVTALSIAKTSKDPDGAWAFLEYVLAYDPVVPGFVGFELWSNKNVMEKIIDKELSLYGKEFEEVINEDGEVHTYYAEHIVNQECVDAFREVLASARKAPAGNSSVKGIVREETWDYFEGQKSIDQVIDAIQKRVGLFLAE
ncbi:MAG: extracellular solute-binding protein [Lachnospiraceae bacterium]|nr:extracellular solute-binding protein [Lachnospiraceae bacterium]